MQDAARHGLGVGTAHGFKPVLYLIEMSRAVRAGEIFTQHAPPFSSIGASADVGMLSGCSRSEIEMRGSVYGHVAKIIRKYLQIFCI
jgi:hypothetical protein